MPRGLPLPIGLTEPAALFDLTWGSVGMTLAGASTLVKLVAPAIS